MIDFERNGIRFIHRTVAVAINNGHALLHRAEWEDFWSLPGGRVEMHETTSEALVREMREELGVEVEVEKVLTVVKHAYTHFRITLHAFWCKLASGEPCCLDCAAFRWVALAELDILPMSVAD